MAAMTTEDKLDQIMVDLASLKTDVSWLKRIFGTCIVLTGVIFGVDLSGAVI